MRSLYLRMACAVLASAAGSLPGRVAVAQGVSLGTTSPYTTSPGVSSMPVPVPLFGPALPSVPGDSTAPATGLSPQNSMFSSPFAAPFLYQSMIQASQPPWMSGSSASLSTGSSATTGSATSSSASASNFANRGLGVSTAQLGLMMMATQNYGGVGSGRLSGARSNPQARSQASAQTATTQGRTRAQPGGLAARYFNRVGGHTSFPQGYYRRQSRYFP